MHIIIKPFFPIFQHGQQVQNALENLDAAALAKLSRERDILDRIDDHMKKLRSRKQNVDKISPAEEVEVARRNLEEVNTIALI